MKNFPNQYLFYSKEHTYAFIEKKNKKIKYSIESKTGPIDIYMLCYGQKGVEKYELLLSCTTTTEEKKNANQ